jgi:hypothetical protein
LGRDKPACPNCCEEDPAGEGHVWDSEPCQRAFLGGRTLAETKEGEDWADPARRLVPVIDPNPEGPLSPVDLNAAADCGVDPNTLGDPCAEVADCPEGSTCGCPSKSSFTATQAALQTELAQWNATVCLSVMNCGPDADCTCGGPPPEADPGAPPPPPPVDEALVDSVFLGNQGVCAYYDLDTDRGSGMALGWLISGERTARDRP